MLLGVDCSNIYGQCKGPSRKTGILFILLGSSKHLTKIELLEKRVQILEDKLTSGAPPSNYYSELILSAVEGRAHVFFQSDLIHAKHIAIAMHEIYPDDEMFHLGDRSLKSLMRASRSMGALLGRTQLFPKLLSRFTIPAAPGCKRSTHNVNVWVLRDLKKYKHLRPSSLYDVQQSMWRATLQEYHASKEPSFF